MNVKMKQSIHNTIVDQIDYNTHEKIGIIGSFGRDVIDFFLLDSKASSSEFSCMPSDISDIASLNNKKLYFVGIVHSHPPQKKMLSDADYSFARSIIKASSNLQFIIMGIVSDHELYLYHVTSKSNEKLDIIFVDC